jgi:GNAT superfamily N-acetyltransferase
MREHWREADPDRNPDLKDIASSYAGATFLTARAVGEMVGTGALVQESEGTARIVQMSVAAHARRKGIGRKIPADPCERARASGQRRIVLETTETWTDAIAFYETFGFRVIEHHNGSTHMALDLDTEV